MTDEHPLSIAEIERLVSAPRLTSLTANAEGEIVATVSLLDAKGSSYSSVLYRLDGGTPQPLTSGPGSAGIVRIRDDGAVFFTAKRPADAPYPYLWMLPPRGEAQLLSTRPGGIGDVHVRGKRIVVVGGVLPAAGDEADHRAGSAKREEAGVSAILHESFPTRLWDSDLGPEVEVVLVGEVPEVCPLPGVEDRDPLSLAALPMPPGRLDGVVVSDDGAVILVTVIAVAGTRERCEVWRLDATEPVRLHAPQPDRNLSALAISPKGDRVIVEEEMAWTPEVAVSVRLLLFDLVTGEARPLFPEADAWFDPVWLDNDTVVATSDHRGRGAVWIGDVDEAAPTLLAGGDGQKWHYSNMSAAGCELVALRSAIDAPPEPVWIDPSTGEVSELPNPVPALELSGSLTEVMATAEDGTPIRAWLALPQGEGPHPLLVCVHGGPWGSWNSWTWRWNPWPFAAEGYAVLLPDPAISTGYGQAMIDRGQQELGGTPCTDILTLTDAAERRGDIDSTRTSLAGGSYGGYMANWMAGHTGRRFRCIVSHASLWDLRTMGNTTDNGGWEEATREQLGTYSPSDFAGNIEVPMLLSHGDKDYRVPIGQSQQLWSELSRRYPEAGHKFLYFPDEGHWVQRPGNIGVWYRTVAAFLDQHVKGKEFDRPMLLG